MLIKNKPPTAFIAPKTIFAIALSISLLATKTSAQEDHPPPVILSYADVNCPTDPSGKSSSNIYALVETVYSEVGVVKIPKHPLSASGLAWVEGITSFNTESNRTFIKDYYLASHPAINLSDGNATGVYALFFTKTNDSLGFGTNNPWE